MYDDYYYYSIKLLNHSVFKTVKMGVVIVPNWPLTAGLKRTRLTKYSPEDYEELRRNTHHGTVEREFLSIFPRDFRLYTAKWQIKPPSGWL